MSSMPVESLSTRSASVLRQAEFRIHQRNPQVEPQWVKRLKNKAIDLVKRRGSSLNVALCFLVDFSSSDGSEDVFEHPERYIFQQSSLPSDNKLIVVVDRHGRYLCQITAQWDEAENWDPVWAAQVSEDQQAVVLHVHNRSLIVYESGVPMEEIWDVWRPKYPFAPISSRHHLAHEYPELVRRHFQDFIQLQKVVIYWKDRRRRIFVGGPERIFQRHLWWYLDEYVLDARDVNMERPLGGLSDRTDIWIETTDNRHYVLEIKWLGRSPSDHYDADRARQGAKQTIVYLDRDDRITRAALVLYDGREVDEAIQWDQAAMHPRLDLSLHLYIESRTASEIGTS